MIIREILNNYVDLEISDKILDGFEKVFNSKSQRDQVMFYFKVEKYLKNSDLLDIFPEYQVNTLTQRLNNSNYIESTDKEGKYLIYSLTKKGEDYLNRIMKTFLDKNIKYQDYLAERRKNKYENSDLKQNAKIILNGLITANIKPNIEDKIIIDLKDLSEWDYETVDLIYTDFRFALETIKAHFKDDVEKELKDQDIIFKNPHETIFKEIHDYDRNYEGLVYTKGLITSKKESIVLQTRNFIYNCHNESCSYFEDKISSGIKIKECPKCKSKLNLIEKKQVNHFESKICNIDSGVVFPLVLREELAKEFAFIGLGDEIEVVGNLEEKLIKQEKGDKEEIIKCLVVNSFRKTDFQKELTKEEILVADRLLKKYPNPKDYLIEAYRDYIEEDYIKELFLLQQLTLFRPETKETPIHFALMGEPGVGKNELIKLSEQYFPINDSIVGADITDAGFKGTVNRDTGIKEVGLAKKTQHGTLWLNEFDKFVKSNNNGKKAASQLLNATITEQEVRLNKAGIKIQFKNLDLRHNVVFNPVEESIVNTGKPAYNFMSQILDKSLLSRMIPLYIKRDRKRSLDVFDLMLKENNTKKINIIIEEYKILIKYLRNKKILLDQEAKKTLKKVYEKILNSDENHTISAERIGQIIIQLSKAIAKFNNLEVCNKDCVKYACNLYWRALSSCGIDKDNLETLFLDKSIEEIKTKVELKTFILKQIEDNEIFQINNFKDKFNEELLNEAIADLKKSGDYAEFRKGELREVKN
tara:strand:- start:2673 stop:4940 length:2268 start_codon:yes stop_codon:yes gene_type:complete